MPPININVEQAVKAITDAASEALKTVAAVTAEAIKSNNAGNTADHDLLIRLETKMGSIKDDIKDLKDGTAAKINDHETRINSLESAKTKQITLLSIGIGILTLLVSLLTYHLFK